MATFTIRVTHSGVNIEGTGYGNQPDLGAPSYFDLVVTNSSEPTLPNGVYDAYCLNPFLQIFFSPTEYNGTQNLAGNDAASFSVSGVGALTQVQVNQLNWLLAQNFTSDPKYGGLYNYGEVQIAIWKIAGFTDAQISTNSDPRLLNDNNNPLNVVNTNDINTLVAQAQAAVASGHNLVPSDAFFSTVIDPAGNAQPLIVQLQSAKLGNFVWLDTNGDGIQQAGEAGVNNVVVELYKGGVLVASTVTGDDFSTAAVENGFYQFAGLQAGNYQVKFVAPVGYSLTTQDAGALDTLDSDANAAGFSPVVALAVGESNQTIDAGLVISQKASLGNYVWLDNDNDGVQNDGNVGVNGVKVELYTAGGALVGT